MNFIVWLKKRKNELTPVGDLARDMISDNDFTGKSKLALKRYMECCGACEDAYIALEHAYARWKK